MNPAAENEELLLDFGSEPETLDVSGGASTFDFVIHDPGVAPRRPIVHLIILVEEAEGIEGSGRRVGGCGSAGGVHRCRWSRDVVVVVVVVAFIFVVVIITVAAGTGIIIVVILDSVITVGAASTIVTTTITVSTATDQKILTPLVVRDSPTAAVSAAALRCATAAAAAASKVKFSFIATVGASKVGAAAEGRIRVGGSLITSECGRRRR